MRTLRAALFAAIALYASSRLLHEPLRGQDASPEKAAITGTVLRAGIGDPIARATVTLTRVGGAQPPQQQGQQQPFNTTATTDAQGKFQLPDLDAGSYRLFAARNGFARQEFGQRSFDRPGTVIHVAAGQQLTGISLSLTPAATVTG